MVFPWKSCLIITSCKDKNFSFNSRKRLRKNIIRKMLIPILTK